VSEAFLVSKQMVHLAMQGEKSFEKEKQILASKGYPEWESTQSFNIHLIKSFS